MEKKTAADARTFCNSVGSKLFEPKDLAGNEFVTSEAKKRGMTQFWIGIGDDKNEGIYRYDGNDETITWSNWYQGYMDIQPNNYGNEDCTAIAVTKMEWASGNVGHDDIKSSNAGKWFDQKCHFEKAFICESAGNSFKIYKYGNRASYELARDMKFF